MKICYNCFNEIPDGAGTCPRCGSSADLRNWDKYPHALPCGSVLNGKYIVGRVLGEGGFGITYIGQQYRTKQLVAIKEYFPDTMATRTASHSVAPFNSNRREGFEYGKKQFLDEAKTLSTFIGSPNIVRVSGYFEENGTAYFVMEYVEGKSLRKYIADRGGRISWEETWSLLMPVLDALSEVHYRNIIHRDIKPDNIIITKSGSAKLIDFGAAKYRHNEKSKSLTAVISSGYAPPEQYYSGGDQGAWTDVYALAATMYFCITGNAPIESVERLVKDTLKNPSEIGISIPEYAETALMKALAVKEQDRFKTTYDFRNTVLEGKRREEINNIETDRGRSVTDSSSEYRSDRDKNPEEKFRKTLELAVQGDSDAQYLVGYFYESGEGVQKSEELAIKWYRKAAAQGNPTAKTMLSLLSEKNPVKENGEIVSKQEPQPGGSKVGTGEDKDIGNTVSDGGQQPRGNSDAGGKQQSLGNGSVGGVQETGTNSGAEGGEKAQVTLKTVTRKKRNAIQPNKILLAVAIFALIVVAILVWPKGGSHSNSEIETGGSGQQTISINENKEQEEPSSLAENDKKEESFYDATVNHPEEAPDDDTAPTSEEATESTSEEASVSITNDIASDDDVPDQDGLDHPNNASSKISRTTDDPMALSDTWEEIIAACKDGTYKERYRLGDTKELDMGSEGIITMKLVAMDEDELADGSGKAAMTWLADELLKTEHNMNSEDTNKGGWEASEMRAWLRETVLALIPEEIRNNICEVTKYSYSYEEQKDVASKDTIWIPSVREVFPAGYGIWTDGCREKEGVSYTNVFTDKEPRERSWDGESGDFWWWLRSASNYVSDTFICVDSDGESYFYRATSGGGVVVGFCLGEAVESSDSESVSHTSNESKDITDSWEEIAAAGLDGTYKDRYRIGDTKELDMGSEGIITMKLVAMDEDELADGSGKAPMTWVADELLQSKHEMNSTSTNEGGWEASEMRVWLRETVLPLMPQEVRNNIREVTKYAYSYDEKKEVASKDTIWIPSARELFLADQSDWVNEYKEIEGVSYTSVFKDNESRKRSRDGESGASWWWMRSASISISNNFSIVGSDGDSHNDNIAFIEGGVVVGFCF